jgi:hypothetical protein
MKLYVNDSKTQIKSQSTKYYITQIVHHYYTNSSLSSFTQINTQSLKVHHIQHTIHHIQNMEASGAFVCHSMTTTPRQHPSRRCYVQDLLLVDAISPIVKFSSTRSVGIPYAIMHAQCGDHLLVGDMPKISRTTPFTCEIRDENIGRDTPVMP